MKIYLFFDFPELTYFSPYLSTDVYTISLYHLITNILRSTTGIPKDMLGKLKRRINFCKNYFMTLHSSIMSRSPIYFLFYLDLFRLNIFFKYNNLMSCFDLDYLLKFVTKKLF